MSARRSRATLLFRRYATIAFCECARLLPLPMARALGRALAMLAYYLIPRIRREGLKNLDLAYGDERTRSEKIRILKGAAKNVGIVAAEFSRTQHLAENSFADMVELRGAGHVDLSQPVVFISAHFGNWEWLAPAMSARGIAVAGIMRPLDDPGLNAYVKRIRSATGTILIERDHAAALMLKLLRERTTVGVLIDQSPRQSAVPVTFFGTPTWATIAPVMAAIRGKAAIHPVSMVRQPDGRYVLSVAPALERIKTGNLRHDLAANAQQCQDAIELMIREHPDQWLWLHRRWKKRERLEQEWKRKR